MWNVPCPADTDLSIAEGQDKIQPAVQTVAQVLIYMVLFEAAFCILVVFLYWIAGYFKVLIHVLI